MASGEALLVLTLVASLLAVANSCAFPAQGCSKSVCDKFSVEAFANFDQLLNKDTFNYTDKRKIGDWSTVPDIGYFFGIYNPLFNGGSYSKDKWAVRDKAPTINYFEWRTNRGIYNGDAVTLGDCCHACRETPGCEIYIFDPQIYRDNDDDPTERHFSDDGQGDCWLLFHGNYTYDKINALCSNQNATDGDFYNPTVKSLFYGGMCNSIATDDPHFVGARGTHFDFNGELDKSFCLVTDTRIQLNALLRGYKDPRAEKAIRSWMKELGFVWLDAAGQVHTLRLVARAGPQRDRGTGFLTQAVLDGVDVPVPYTQDSTFSEGLLTLRYEGMRKHGPFEIDGFRLAIGEELDLSLSLRVAHPLLQTPEDAEVHFNILFHKVQSSENVHGILGQTYRQSLTQVTKAIEYSLLSRILGAPVQADGASGKGFLDGEMHDYVTTTVLSTDCKFSSLGF